MPVSPTRRLRRSTHTPATSGILTDHTNGVIKPGSISLEMAFE